jgi:hypothetical protein
MSINNKFEEIVNFCLDDVDEKGDHIIYQQTADNTGTKIFTDQLPPMVFPFGYMIVSSTFMFFDEDEEDGNEE